MYDKLKFRNNKKLLLGVYTGCTHTPVPNAKKRSDKNAPRGKKTQAYRFPDDTRKLIGLLSEATGLTMTDVIIRCVNGYATKLVKETEKEKADAQRQLSKRLKDLS